jgi:hypothetical protein
MKRGRLQNSDENIGGAAARDAAHVRNCATLEESERGEALMRGLPAIALGAIGGNRIIVELRPLHGARIAGAEFRGAEVGIRLSATTVECEQAERDDQENAQVHPSQGDKGSHQREQIVHFTLPPSLLVMQPDRKCERFGRCAARHGARRPRSRANSVPRTTARPARNAALHSSEGAGDREREVAFP